MIGENLESIDDVSDHEEINNSSEQPTAVSDYSDEQHQASMSLTTLIILQVGSCVEVFVSKFSNKRYAFYDSHNSLE